MVGIRCLSDAVSSAFASSLGIVPSVESSIVQQAQSTWAADQGADRVMEMPRTLQRRADANEAADAKKVVRRLGGVQRTCI